MSKHNKVNPGQYTQAGRLSADDAARELTKQTQPGIGHRDTAAAEHRERDTVRPGDKPKDSPADAADADDDSSATKTDGTAGRKPADSK